MGPQGVQVGGVYGASAHLTCHSAACLILVVGNKWDGVGRWLYGLLLDGAAAASATAMRQGRWRVVVAWLVGPEVHGCSVWGSSNPLPPVLCGLFIPRMHQPRACQIPLAPACLPPPVHEKREITPENKP